MTITTFTTACCLLGLFPVVLGVLFVGYLRDRERLRLMKMKREADEKRVSQWIR